MFPVAKEAKDYAGIAKSEEDVEELVGGRRWKPGEAVCQDWMAVEPMA